MASSQRIDPFAGVDEDLDLSGLTSARRQKPKADKAETRATAESLGFKSREPASAASLVESAPPRSLRRQRSTKEQFNLRAERNDIDRLCEIAAQQKWLLGDAFGEAVAALAEKLARRS